MSTRTDSWYTTAARRTLADAGIPGIDTLGQPGLTGAQAMHSGTTGAAVVQVGHNHRGHVYDLRPAPRFTAACQAWDAAREQVAAAFTADGYPEPTRTRLGLYVQVPDHLGTPATVVLDSNAFLGDHGRYTATINGDHGLVAVIDGSLAVPTVSGFSLTEQGAFLGRYDTAEAAARSYALARGFGPQITVTTR